MKKRNLTTLKLNKKTISPLFIKGGRKAEPSDTCTRPSGCSSCDLVNQTTGN